MTRPLIETKLYRPTPRPGLVTRPRLGALLDAEPHTRLVLVSAPAGFGKSTLLAEWLAEPRRDRTVAWLWLDPGDREPATFWTSVVTALHRAVPGAGAGALELLQSAQPPIETAVASVLNDLAAAPGTDLVLDDYHAVDGPATAAGMAFLLDHLPPGMRVVISTRADPALPLPRLRARGELVEVRAADLRFTCDEAATYLNGILRLGVTPTDIESLERRTEGWAAALHLAALSLRGRDDVSAFIAGFTGDDRHIVDYLMTEVLHGQPGPVREFLLRTSVLDRLTGDLCDAVTGRRDGAATLEALDRGNLFTIPLDDHRRWYRYHHLFGDVLQARLRAEHPETLPGLHARASRWYENHDEPLPAIRHALAAGDAGRAADLAELAVPALRRSRQEAVIRSWLDLIPDRLVRVRPVLAVGLAGALLAGGEAEGVEDRLRDAERMLASPARVVVDHRELPRLPAAIAMYRAALALARGDLPATADHATRAIAVSAADDHLGTAGASGLLGLVYWTTGDLDAAYRAWTDSAAGLEAAGYIADVFGSAIARADISLAQGRPSAALRTYRDAIDLAARQPGGAPRGIADLYVGLSEIHLVRGDLAAADSALRRAGELGERAGLPQNRYRYRVALALLRDAQGDPDGAVELLDEAERVYVGDYFPNVRPVAAVRARVRVAHGDLAAAESWMLLPGDLSYLHEYEHITVARVLLAASSPEVAGLLDRLLAAAEAGGRTGSVIEILVLRALAGRALPPLERAIGLAEPEGYVRVFAAEGPPMAALLRRVARRRGESGYLRRLLAATSPAPEPASGGGAAEPLSARELDVLRLLRTDLDGPAIARELVVSLNTLRTHTRNIYAKLGVTNRRAAVRKADELGLARR